MTAQTDARDSQIDRTVVEYDAGYVEIDGEMVGPKMLTAVRRVRACGPYASMNELAISVGPNGSQRYGYEIVNRCRSKGLLELDPEHPDATPQGRGAVVLTQKGMDLIASLNDD